MKGVGHVYDRQNWGEHMEATSNVRAGCRAPEGVGWIGRYRVCVALLMAAGLASGCASSLHNWVANGFKVGPNYCQPGAPLEAQWIDFHRDERIRDESPDTSSWWTVFDDAKLNELVNLALQQNLTLRTAGTRILEARAIRGIAVGGLFPQTQQAIGAFSRVSESGNVANPVNDLHYNLWEGGFNLSWELDFWGRFRRGIEAADAELNSSVESYDDVLVILLSEVATNYVQIRTFQERLRLARDNVKSQSQTMDVAQKRFNEKAISKIDLLEMRNNVAQTKALAETLELGLRRANDALCVLMGIPPRDLIAEPMVAEGPLPAAPPQVAVGIPAELLRRRPDIRRAERLVAAQSARIGIAQSDLYPHFAINGVLDWQTRNLNQLFTPQSLSGAVGPAFTWNILNYGRLVNLVRLEEARFEGLVYTYQNTVLTAQREAEDALVGFVRSQEQEKNLRDAVAALSEAEQLALSEATEGGRNYNRLYVIQFRKTQQQDDWAVSRGDIALNLIGIYRALGGGWQIRLQSSAPASAMVIADDAPAPTPPEGKRAASTTSAAGKSPRR
jgi:NodT family efflux transporter outer membrane factor (OMF) lipoprotein